MNAGRARLNPLIGRFCRSVGGRPVLAREALLAHVFAHDAALSSAGTTGFALHGESLFPNAEKVTKNACPCIRVSLRSTSLIPSLLRGSPRKGHPWPFTALAASMPLAPLRSDSIRPPERGVRSRLAGRAMEKQEAVSSQGHLTNGREKFVGWKTAKHFPPQTAPQSVSNLARENRWVSFALPTLHKASATASLHGPSDTTESPLSGGRAQVAWKGLSGMDAARAALGHGWPVAAGPWNVTGAREVERSEPWMQGQDLLVPFGATAKRDSPSRAKPMPRPTPLIGHTSRSPSPQASRASSVLQKHATASSGVQAFTSQVLPC
jgi:hypothetical protein